MQIPDQFSDTSSTVSDTVREEARVWLYRLTSGHVTEWDAQAFRRWESASPAHQQAFNDAKRQWQLMQPVIGNMLHTRPQVARHHASVMASSRMGRRLFLGGMVSAAAVSAVVVMNPALRWRLSPDEWRADYQTAIGEQQTLTMADTSALTLNTRTSIRKQADEATTTNLELLTGEAAIDLAAGGRGVGVQAGAGRSVAYGGRFEVRHLDGQVCVTCIQGEVRIYHPAGDRVLQTAQQTVYDTQAISGVSQADTAVVSAWRTGELVFKQMPLQQALNEINRYRSGHILLMKSEMRNTRVSGRFSIHNLDAALLQLQHTFALNARSLPGGMLILS